MSVPPEAMSPVAGAVQQGIIDPTGGAGAPTPPGAVAAPAQEVSYEQFFDNISRIIDGEPGLEKLQDAILQMMARGSQYPARALSQATLEVGELVFQDAQQKGIVVTEDMLAAAAMDTLTSLDELASAAGIFEATDEDLQEAFTLTIEGWMQRHPELIDQEGIRQSLAELEPGLIQEAQDMFGGVQQAPAQAPAQGGLING